MLKKKKSWGWEDSPEEGMETHSSILAWRIPMDRGAWRAIVHGVAKSWTRLRLTTAQHMNPLRNSFLENSMDRRA